MEKWRLTQQQYDQLNRLFEQIQMTSSDYSASGLHYVLIALLQGFGFTPYNSYDAIQLAEELLSSEPI